MFRASIILQENTQQQLKIFVRHGIQTHRIRDRPHRCNVLTTVYHMYLLE